jgi:hypothetical protein
MHVLFFPDSYNSRKSPRHFMPFLSIEHGMMSNYFWVVTRLYQESLFFHLTALLVLLSTTARASIVWSDFHGAIVSALAKSNNITPGRPSDSSTSPKGVGRLFFTARIERALSHRARSASKKNGLPASSHHMRRHIARAKEPNGSPLPLLHRAGCEDGRAGQRQDPLSCPHHLQLPLIPLQRLQHRQENQSTIFIAQDIFRAALRMRHQAEHIAFCVDDSRNVIQ